MTRRKRSMEIDVSDKSQSQSQGQGQGPPKKPLVAISVAGNSTGEGLPYAPEDWPLPGDKWRWRVGNRKAGLGHWVDRFLYPPAHLGKSGFSSKVSVGEFVRKEFPDTNVEDFFASFIWRVPCGDHTPRKDVVPYVSSRRLDMDEVSGSEAPSEAENCKAGNSMCSSQSKARSSGPIAKACNICCVERKFCHDCCCILCSRPVDWAHGGYSFIRCEAILEENCICGHLAHIDCALRCYMGGTVGGSIGLDVEYFCRHCDNRTDLIPHVTKLLKACEALDSRDDIDKILSMGLSILRGSEQMKAKSLRTRIASIMAKLKRGVPLDEIWKVDDHISTVTSGDLFGNGEEITMIEAADIANVTNMDTMIVAEPSQVNGTNHGGVQSWGYITSDHSSISLKLEDNIDKVLEELKRSQETEYRIAELKLYAQKDFLLSLYQQLEVERSELANLKSPPNAGEDDALLSNVLNRVDEIKHEELKLHDMMKVAKGFGRVEKRILNDNFGLTTDC